MFCESVLWRMLLCQDALHCEPEPKPPHRTSGVPPVGGPEEASVLLAASPSSVSSSSSSRAGCGALPGVSQSAPRQVVVAPWLPAPSPREAFLVPPSCQSICDNYSDLLIGGDQVLPLSSCLDQPGAGAHHGSPFLQSSEIPPAPALEPSPPQDPPHRCGDSARWRRGGSGKEDRNFLAHQGGRPLSNSQLNAYLEQKLLDLYRQYMAESLARRGSPPAVLASELVLSGMDHITQQLSREQNVEAARAKDMVISCLLRVASGLPSVSGEISTPQLQISDDLP